MSLAVGRIEDRAGREQIIQQRLDLACKAAGIAAQVDAKEMPSVNLLLSFERISVRASSSLRSRMFSPSTELMIMPAETPASAAAEPAFTEMTRK